MKPASRYCRRAFSSALVVIVALLAAYPAQASIRYRVSLAHHDEHLFQISMEIPAGDDPTVVAMPAWNALYQVRDFAYRVRGLRAAAVPESGGAGRGLAVSSLDKQTWQIAPSQTRGRAEAVSKQVVSYFIEWDDPGPFNTQLNAHHAFVNLAEILMYVPNRRGEDTEVIFENLPSEWNLIAELAAGPDANSFTAESYDALVDAPVEAGKFESFAFDRQGAHFRVVVDGREWNKGRLEDSLNRITAYELRLMSGPPFKEYTFFFHFGTYAEVGAGGMEHANSTSIAAVSVESAAAVAAHEFFHAWNVKRIRPQSLEPVDYTKEQYTRALWFAEGVTSTYAAYTLERTNLWTKDQFYEDIAGQISELQSRPAHTWQSVEESSLDAWLEKYDAYNSPERSISYYNKGQLIGLLLDLSIRGSTDNHKSLDDVLRAMNDEYGKPARPYRDSDGIRSVAEEVAGRSFEDFFRRFVGGTEEIPYNDFLGLAGLELKVETTKAPDLGFWPGRESSEGVLVSDLEPGSAAEAAGLHDGDMILPPRGRSAQGDFSQWLRNRSSGDSLMLHVRRGSEQIEIMFLVGSRQDRQYSIVERPDPSEKQTRIREGLLRGTTD